MRKKTFWGICLVALGLMMGLVGCKEPEKPNFLLGTWKVFYANKGGIIMGGPKFKGSEYTFRPDGTVFARSTSNSFQDSITNRYRLHNDTLTYIGIDVETEEHYHVDTLNAKRLVISAYFEGIPTEIRMFKVKN